MIYFVLACLIGIIAGMRSMTAPATVSIAAHYGLLSLNDTFLAFLAYGTTTYILIFAAIVELIVDKLPFTPSRKTPLGFAIRLTMGAICGAAIITAGGYDLWSISGAIGGIMGIVGAIIGTLGGAEFRRRLATAFVKDWPAALIEDLIAVLGVALILATIYKF